MPNITARDVPTILGENPYETAWQLLEKKVEKKHPFFGNVFTEHGVKYEDTALLLYNRVTGNFFQESPKNIKHPKYKFVTGRPDAITVNNCVVEIKCPYNKKFRELTVESDVPRHYWVQCQVYMEMLDIEVCHYVECFIDSGSPTDGSVGKISYIAICRNRRWWEDSLPHIIEFNKEMKYWLVKKNLEEHEVRICENKWVSKYR